MYFGAPVVLRHRSEFWHQDIELAGVALGVPWRDEIGMLVVWQAWLESRTRGSGKFNHGSDYASVWNTVLNKTGNRISSRFA